jgi:hypothetical protein
MSNIVSAAIFGTVLGAAAHEDDEGPEVLAKKCIIL